MKPFLAYLTGGLFFGNFNVEQINPQWVLNALFTITGALLGWLLNSIRESIRDLQSQDSIISDKVQHIEVYLAGNYVKREDMKELSDTLFKKLDRIESKLDGKQDK